MPTPRTAAEIEADLASIDTAITEQTLEQVQNDNASTAGTGGAAKAAPKAQERDFDYEARRRGWKPESEYTGPEGKWVDAKTFVERGERFTSKLEKEVESLKGQIATFEGTKAQFRKFFDEQMAKRDKEHAEAIAALRIQRSAAIREGDDELAVELEDRIDATRKQQAALKTEAADAAADRTDAAAAPALKVSPVFQEWAEEPGNEWFKTDDTLAQHAISVAKELRGAGEKAIGRAFIEKVAEQVRADFPRRFRDIDSSTGKPVSTGGRSQSSAGAASQTGYNGKTERDLPPADLALMRQFVKDGLYTKEQFLKSYFSRNQ